MSKVIASHPRGAGKTTKARKFGKHFGMMTNEMLQEATLTKKETEALKKSLRASKRRSKIVIPEKDQIVAPPYAILPLLPYIPKDWIVWDSAAKKQGFLAEAIRAMNGNVVIENGLEVDGADFLSIPPKTIAQVQITNPPPSVLYEWIARSYDNRQAFALLMPFDTWAAAEAQSVFQRYGVSVILLNRPLIFHAPIVGWAQDQKAAWFTWGLPYLKEAVTYGHIPLIRNLPQWMVSPTHKREITAGAKSMEDRLAIRHATNPLQWPAPIRKGG